MAGSLRKHIGRKQIRSKSAPTDLSRPASKPDCGTAGHHRPTLYIHRPLGRCRLGTRPGCGALHGDAITEDLHLADRIAV